jgi:protein transport protein SEC24
VDEDAKIPENLQLLPLYTLALMKNVSLRGGTDVHPDERIAAHLAMAHMFVDETLSFIHPRLYAIHNMDAQCGMPSGNDADEVDTAGRNKIILPNACNLSVDRLNSEGVFLLDNGKDSYIWVGRAANPAVVGSLFGVESLNTVDPSQVSSLEESTIIKCCQSVQNLIM